ncbi:Translation factor pelota [Lodderomyces elongisporus]|uniref:Translation factor pelota n=1 Tax=Lodderomyces elongisporus TaxID=36914 RepID=UPI00291E68B1|nr:Translation factor pelota [Lodderomyces elongisporus]WLF76518.1 Translation factor pelota [Lodderomyces elongisporus]
MQVKNRVKLKDKNVALTLIPEDSEDLWYIFNLVKKGDTVQLLTHRNVKKGNQNQITKGKSKMEKILVKLRLLVEEVDYIASDLTMRINGKSLLQQEFIPLNSYHTAEVELNKEISIVKESWDEYDMTLLNDLCSVEKKADIGAVVFQEGVAHVCYVTEQMTVLQSKVEKSIPRKNKEYGTRDLDKAMNSFYNMIIQAIIRHFDFEKLKVIILASPGFLAKTLYDRLIQECTNLQSTGNTKDAKKFNSILSNKSKILVAHCSTGYLQGLEEVLEDPQSQKKLADTKFFEESEVLSKFQRALNEDDGRAWYGLEEIQKALQMDAVRFLMISDQLFQNDDIEVRRMYIDLSEQAKALGAKVYIFSSLHESGIQLNQLTGIAALLKYPVPDLDESDEE